LQQFFKSQQLKEISMKKAWIVCLLGLLTIGSVARSRAQATDGTEKAVAALEEQWLQSQKTNNPDLVAPLLADKFVNTGSDGKVMNKAESLANAKATKYVSADYEDVKVTVFGDTAIATGGFKAKGTDASGKPMDIHERWTDSWVKMPNGKWQCVATHGSAIKM
jgi:ketosteroid isomerase-like protein